MNSAAQLNYEQIKEFLGEHQVVGDQHAISFSKLKPIDQADSESLVFISKERKDKNKLATDTKSHIILTNNIDGISEEILKEKKFIIVEDPKITFSKIGNFFFVKKKEHFIHPTAVIHKEAKIGKNVTIGPYSVIGKGEIGEGTIIYGHVFIYDDYCIGKNVKINAGTVIGAEGFGYNKDSNGITYQFPHLGSVIIEDNVEIGANTAIDRGALGDTVIRKNAKIDNLVHIAHNVVVGENAYIIANTVVGGSTKIGNNVYISPSVTLRDQLTIGEGAVIGQLSSVLKNVPSNETWTGIPAQSLDNLKLLNEKLKKL